MVAIVVSLVAVAAWAAVLIAQARADDERRTSLMMPVTALIASLGTLASALGFAQQTGTLTLNIDPQILTLVASMGRGALAAAGIIVFTESPSVARRHKRG